MFNFLIGTGRYTIENTLLYSLLYILAFILLYFFIKNKKIVIEKYFNINLILSFSIITLIRVSMDMGWIESLFLFYTPYMQILVLSLFSVNIIDNNKRKDFFYFYLIILLISILFFIKKLPNLFFIPASIILILIIYIFYKENKKYYYFLPIFSQFLDGIYGNLGILLFGYSPKHVVHSFILYKFGVTFGIFIFLTLKFIILILTIILVEKKLKDLDLKEIFYLMLFYVGYNAGLRNMLLVSFS